MGLTFATCVTICFSLLWRSRQGGGAKQFSQPPPLPPQPPHAPRLHLLAPAHHLVALAPLLVIPNTRLPADQNQDNMHIKWSPMLLSLTPFETRANDILYARLALHSPSTFRLIMISRLPSMHARISPRHPLLCGRLTPPPWPPCRR